MLINPTPAHFKPSCYVSDGLTVALPSPKDSVTNRFKFAVESRTATTAVVHPLGRNSALIQVAICQQVDSLLPESPRLS